jgi:hypothetical protein
MKICYNHCSVFAKKLKKRQAESKDLVYIQGIGQEMVSFYGFPGLSLLHEEYADQYVL